MRCRRCGRVSEGREISLYIYVSVSVSVSVCV